MTNCLKSTSNVYTCDDVGVDAAFGGAGTGGGGVLQSATLWVGVAGLFFCGFLIKRKINGAIIFSVLFMSIISWIPDHSASYWDKGG